MSTGLGIAVSTSTNQFTGIAVVIPPSYLLLETGDYLLLENGSRIKL